MRLHCHRSFMDILLDFDRERCRARAGRPRGLRDLADSLQRCAHGGAHTSPGGLPRRCRAPIPPPVPPPPRSTPDQIFLGAGDIGNCAGGREGDGKLLDRIGGMVFTLGDNAYEEGSARNFANCYEPFWGRHKSRTRPSPGNHDYVNASPYFWSFGGRAGESSSGSAD